MNCSGYERQMPDYLDGRLSRAKEDALRFHLNGCPRCRLKIMDMESSIRAVKSLPAVTPRPEFDYQFRSLLTKEIARELYAASWWRRVSGALAELGELSRQRPVQLVFATSLLLTITVIGGFAGLVAPPERSESSPDVSMTVSLPPPFEPELAPPEPISPFPLERGLAPHLAIESALNTGQASSIPSPAATSLPLTTSGFTRDGPGVMTVRTLEPGTHGLRSVSAAGTGMRLDPSLFTGSLGHDLVTGGGIARSESEARLRQAGSGELNDPRQATGTPGPAGLPTPIRRIRISF